VFLIGSATAQYPPYLAELAETQPLKAFVGTIVTIPFPAGLLTLLFLFPDGRFVPGWTKIPVLAALAVLIAGFLPSPGANSVGSGWLDAITLVGVLVIAVYSQVYRFRTTPDPVTRRQLRTSGVALAGALGAFVAFNVALDLGNLDDPGFPPVLAVVFVLSPVFAIFSVFLGVVLAVSVVKHRLFDIEVAVNRSVVFIGLTVAVGALYAAVVGGAAAVFNVNANGLVAVVGAAAAAVAFQPIRSRMQRAANRLLYGQRDEPYSVVSQLARHMETAAGPDELPAAVVEAVTRGMKLPYATIVTDQGAVLAEAGAPTETRFSAPIVHGGLTIGYLKVAPWPGTPLAARDKRLLSDLAVQAGAAIHAVGLRADLLRSRHDLVTAREEERRRIRRDLHDGLGPRLASLMMRIETARDQEGTGSPEVLTDLAERVNGAIVDIRRLVYGLRPPALDDLGLTGALEQTAAQGSGATTVSVSSAGLAALPAAVEVAAFRIAEEGITNAIRHSGASHCRVILQGERGLLKVSVEDNGRGIEFGAPPGVGLRSMRDRAEELGGTFEVSRTEPGTRVLAVLPIADAALGAVR
jgi:signal transduction histidine kinase